MSARNFSIRHPAKRSFASDVDTKKVGTVRSTSSASKDKNNFRRKSIGNDVHNYPLYLAARFPLSA